MKTHLSKLLQCIAGMPWYAWALLAVALVGFCLRMEVVLGNWSLPLNYSQRTDSSSYLILGREWSNKQPPIYGSDPDFTYGPLYPAFLGMMMRARVHLETDLGIVVPVRIMIGATQSALSAISVFALGAVLCRHLSAAIGLLAATLLAVWPGQVLQSDMTMTEPLFTALFTLVFFWQEQISIKRLVCIGFMLGVVSLIRPAALPVIILVVVLVAIQYGLKSRYALWRVGAVVVGASIVLVPWLALTTAVTGRPIVTTSTGFNLCMGNSDGANGTYRQTACDSDSVWLSSTKSDSHKAKAAIAWAADNPGQEYRLIGKRTHWLWFEGDSYFAHQDSSQPGYQYPVSRQMQVDKADTFWGYIFPLAAMGLIVGLVRFSIFRKMVLMVAGLLVMPYITFADARFHDPVVPMMAVCVAVLAVSIAQACVWYVRWLVRATTNLR